MQNRVSNGTFNPMSEVIKPKIVGAEYQDDVALWSVNERGLSGASFVEVPELTLEAIANIEKLPDGLAWVVFYKQALVRIRHLEGIGSAGEEALYGDRQKVGEEQFVIDMKDRIPAFATKGAILEKGEFTPYMNRWLTSIADNSWHRSYVLEEFEELFGRDLT